MRVQGCTLNPIIRAGERASSIRRLLQAYEPRGSGCKPEPACVMKTPISTLLRQGLLRVNGCFGSGGSLRLRRAKVEGPVCTIARQTAPCCGGPERQGFLRAFPSSTRRRTASTLLRGPCRAGLRQAGGPCGSWKAISRPGRGAVGLRGLRSSWRRPPCTSC